MPPISRRKFAAALVAAVLVRPTLGLAASSRDESPFAPFDDEIGAFMRARDIPGGALAVVKDQRLVYARGYGWADREQAIRVRPDALFRIASVTKPFTAVAVLKLVEHGRLRLEDRAFDLVRLPPLGSAGKTADARLAAITVGQLLHHIGGWDRDRSFDPMFRSRQIAEACGVPSPPGPKEIIRYMLGQPLDFAPGARFAYSNFGYCVLGRVIERVTGVTYERFVRESILRPIGIHRMRLGASLEAGRLPGEVRYYTTSRGTAPSVFGRVPKPVPWPYGGFCLEAMDAHGGWVASVVDLARFAAALHAPRDGAVLRPATFTQLYAPPDPPVARNPDGTLKEWYYACGWSVRRLRAPGQANYWHDGSLPGTFSLLVRRADGLSWAVLFNQRSEDSKLPDLALDRRLHRAADAVSKWPAGDLFPKFHS